MKKLTIALSLLLSATAFSAEALPSLTFNETLINKDSASAFGLYYVANRFVSNWCLNRGNAMAISNFEAAKYLDNLANGLYRCSGDFVQIPGERTQPVTIFKIETCTEVNPADLRLSCPTSSKP